MKKRILSMLLAIVMVVGLMPGFAVTASAEDGDTTTVEAKWGASADDLTNSGTLEAAITAATDENSSVGYIQLQSKVTRDSSIFVESGEFTIDLNGCEWESNTYTLYVGGSANVKIVDTATGGTLKTTYDGCSAILLYDSATLEIAGGTIEAVGVAAVDMSYSGIATEAELIVSGGNIKTDGSQAIRASGNKVTISGGTITTVNLVWDNGKIDLSGHPNPEVITFTLGSDTVKLSDITLPTGYSIYDVDNPNTAVTELSINVNYYIIGKVQTGGTYTVSVSANPAEGGTVEGGGTYTKDASVTVTATANDGYTFTGWMKNGNVVSTNASYTFTMPASDVTVSATFVSCDHTGNINDSFTSDGKETHSKICSVCGNAVETKGHEWVEGVCTGCNTLKAFLAGSNLTLEGVIGFNFFFEIDDDIMNNNTAKVQFTYHSSADYGTLETQIVPVNEYKTYYDDNGNNDVYKDMRVYTHEVFAKQMADDIKVKVVVEINGETYESEEYSCSVVEYAELVFKDALKGTISDQKNEELKVLMTNMLNYGASAQIYFDYNEDNLANEILKNYNTQE